MKKRWLAVGVCLLMLVSLLTGCIKTEENADSSAEGEEKEITVATTSESGGLDPAGEIAVTYLVYAASALDELLTYGEDGEIDYRGAESYEVNEDDSVWTFHLRKDAKWSDGTPVTAKDYLNTITRSLDPKSGNGYAVYLYCIRNAEEIYNGEADMDTLGVKALDDYTLEFTLRAPCVYFLDLLRLPVFTPSCAQQADAVGSGWDTDPEKSLSNGPFCLKEYVRNQYFILEKNPYYWNADEVKLDRIIYRFFDNTQSMSDAYKAGEIDVATELTGSIMEEYEGKDDLVVNPLIATRYIYPNLEAEPLGDVRVREALNLALNREELCSTVGGNTEPTVNLVAKYMKNKSTGKYFSEETEPLFEENIERAQKLLAEAGYPDGKGFPELTYKYPSLEMDADTAQIVQEQWKKNLGITVKLEAQELEVNYSDRHASNFELCRMNWTADFSDPYTYLSLLLSNSTYNCSHVEDETFDSLVNASDAELVPEKRMEVLHQAEKCAVGEKYYVIPLYAVKSVNLVNPKITGIRTIAASGWMEYRYADIEK